MRAVRPVLVAAVLTLAGCGVVTDPDTVTPDDYVEPPEVDPEAEDTFSADAVQEAFAVVSELSLDQGYPEELLDPQDTSFTAEELSGEIPQYMTEEATAAWETLVSEAAAGDEEAADGVRLLRFFDVEEPTWDVPPEDDVLGAQQVIGGEVSVDTTTGEEPLLVVAFDHAATLHFLHPNDVVVDVEVRKSLVLHLTPAPEGDEPSWLVEVFDGDYTFPELEEDE